MPSTKKSASRKWATLPRKSDYTKSFLKDWDRLSRTGRFDMNRLKEPMMLIIADEGPLPPEWLDHELQGNWADHRECHAGGDFLLIYLVDEFSVTFVRCGTHAELFE